MSWSQVDAAIDFWSNGSGWGQGVHEYSLSEFSDEQAVRDMIKHVYDNSPSVAAVRDRIGQRKGSH